MNKTAKEKFEAKGFECCYSKNHIEYLYTDGYFDFIIRFNLETKSYSFEDEFYNFHIDMELHEIINYQLRELGWLK